MGESPTWPDWVKAELRRLPEAESAGRAQVGHDPLRAVAARYDRRHRRVVVELANGCVFAFPVDLAQGLAGAKAADLADIEITPLGTGLHWPRLNADLTVEGLLAGVFGGRAWMRSLAARGGRVTSAAKAAAARRNGAKGGRPRKAVA